MRRIVLIFVLAGATGFNISYAQQIVQPFPDGGPYNPEKEPNIDMYLSDWCMSPARQIHGTLVLRDILVRGNSLNPLRKGAVLNYINYVSYAMLEPRASTAPEALSGTQELYYIVSGRGVVKAGGTVAELEKGVAVFIPEGVEFTISNTGTERLEMYLVEEPTPDGFEPVKRILVKDTLKMPFISIGGHWWHKLKSLFTGSDGLAQIETVLLVSFDPMTLGHPHIYPAGQLEVWLAVEGTTTAWISKQIRLQPPGTAYMVPPNGTISHSNINSSDREAVFFYLFSNPK